MSRIATLISLVIAVLTYALMIIKLKVLDKNDYYMLPAGEKIYNFLARIKLVK